MQQRVDPFIPVHGKKPAPQGQYGANWLRKPEVTVLRPVAATPVPPKPKVPPTATRFQPPRSRSMDGIVSTHVPTPRTIPTPPKAPTIQRPKPTTFDIAPRRPQHSISRQRQTEITQTPSQPLQQIAREPFTEHLAKVNLTKLTQFTIPAKAQIPALVLGAIAAGLSIQFLPLGEIIIGVYAVYVLARSVPSRTSFMLALTALTGIVIILAVRGTDGLVENFAVYAFLLLAIGTVSLGREIRHREA